jgi:hypothetical protein
MKSTQRRVGKAQRAHRRRVRVGTARKRAFAHPTLAISGFALVEALKAELSGFFDGSYLAQLESRLFM